MDVNLNKGNFVNDMYVLPFSGDKIATFVIVDEEFDDLQGERQVFNRINIQVKRYAEDGTAISGDYGSSVIGIGNFVSGIFSDDLSLRGKLMTKDNMEVCTVRLYE
jgi:hypothetical protein